MYADAICFDFAPIALFIIFLKLFKVNEGTRTYDEIVMNPAALFVNQDQSITSTLTLQPQDKDMSA